MKSGGPDNAEDSQGEGSQAEGTDRHDPRADHAKLKAQVEAVLDKLGLNPSDAIRLFYKQISLSNGLPFPVEIPNAATRKALRDADNGKVARYGSAAQLFEKLDI